MTEHRPSTSTAFAVLIGTAMVIALLWVRYGAGLALLFHVLVEMFAICVALAGLAVAWNTRRSATQGYLLAIGVTYGVVALVDLAHMVTYKGMSLVPGITANVPTQLWLVGRYLQAAAVVVAPMYLHRRPRSGVLLASFGVAAIALVGTVALGWFPDAFIEASGLTPFKIASEYATATVMGIGLVLLARSRAEWDRSVYVLLASSIVTGIAAGLAFTLYTDPFGPANVIGHLLRIVMYYLVYRALVENALRRPYDVLFRELSQTAEALRDSEIRFRSTFEQATLGIAHVTLSGEYARANRTMSAITGLTIDALLVTGPAQITHPVDRHTEDRLVARMLAGEIEDFRLEKRLIRPGGEPIWVNTARTLLHTPEGEPRYFVEILEDITARKQAEARLRSSRDLSAALEEIDRAVLSSRTLSEMLGRCVRLITSALDADSGAAFLRDDGCWHSAFTWRLAPDDSKVDNPTWVEEMLPVLIAGEPVVISDTQHDPRLDQDFAHRNAIRSAVALPLLDRSQGDRDLCQGVILAHYHGAPHAFTTEEREFCRNLASVLAIAVENASLHAAERRIADTLQTELLGVPAHVPGVEVAHAYRSATRLARIGGDFYDVFQTSPQRMAFVLGDVSGKGIEAASLTAVAKSTFRAFARGESSPSDVVSAVNLALESQIGDCRFITAVFGYLELATGRTEVVCAGHPAPLVCGSDGCQEDTSVSNPPLGLFPEQVFEHYELRLQPGDVLIAFSDGLIDARSDGEPLGEQGVGRIVDAAGAAHLEGLVAALLGAAEEGEGDRADDVAIVAIKYVGLPAS